jgi:hypothetical protein
MSRDPFTLPDGYVFDVLPSAKETAILRQLQSGDRILVARDGRGYVWERSPGKLRRYLVKAVLNKHWASPLPRRPDIRRPDRWHAQPAR